MSIRTIEQLLVETRLFADLPEHHLATAGCAVTAHFEGVHLPRRRPADTFYVLRSGSIALETHVPGRGAAPLDDHPRPGRARLVMALPPYRWISTPARSGRSRARLRRRLPAPEVDRRPRARLRADAPLRRGDRQPSAGDAHAAARRLPPRWLSRHAPRLRPGSRGSTARPRTRGRSSSSRPRAATRFVSHRASSRWCTRSAPARCRSRSAATLRRTIASSTRFGSRSDHAHLRARARRHARNPGSIRHRVAAGTRRGRRRGRGRRRDRAGAAARALRGARSA